MLLWYEWYYKVMIKVPYDMRNTEFKNCMLINPEMYM